MRSRKRQEKKAKTGQVALGGAAELTDRHSSLAASVDPTPAPAAVLLDSRPFAKQNAIAPS